MQDPISSTEKLKIKNKELWAPFLHWGLRPKDIKLPMVSVLGVFRDRDNDPQGSEHPEGLSGNNSPYVFLRIKPRCLTTGFLSFYNSSQSSVAVIMKSEFPSRRHHLLERIPAMKGPL